MDVVVERDAIEKAILPWLEGKLCEDLNEQWKLELREESSTREDRFVLYAFRPNGLPFYNIRLYREKLFDRGEDEVIDYLIDAMKYLESEITKGAIPRPPRFIGGKYGSQT